MRPLSRKIVTNVRLSVEEGLEQHKQSKFDIGRMAKLAGGRAWLCGFLVSSSRAVGSRTSSAARSCRQSPTGC